MSGIGHNGAPQDEGWIKRYRSVRDHWLVGHGIHVKPADPSKPRCHTQGEAWEDMIMECRYEAGYINNGGKKMELRRGEMLGAVSWLASRWNWTPKTVRRFLDQLENDGMIELIRNGVKEGKQKGKQANALKVCNYDALQSNGSTEGQAIGHAEGKQWASKGQAEGENLRKEEGKNIIPPLVPPAGGNDPDEKTEAEDKPDDKSPRGTRLPDDWVLPRAWGEWAMQHFEVSADDVRGEAAKFRDYWHARAGAQARKIDWQKTWQNWFRTEAGRRRWRIRKIETSAAPDLIGTSSPKNWMDAKAADLAGLDDEHQRLLVAQHANGIWPSTELAYPPGHPKCAIRPAAYRAEGITEKTYDENGVRRDGRGH